MPSKHRILCHPLFLQPSIFPIIRIFSIESALRIKWPKFWCFSFSISPSNEYSGPIIFIIDWLNLLAVQGTLKGLLQHHSSKALYFNWTITLQHCGDFCHTLNWPESARMHMCPPILNSPSTSLPTPSLLVVPEHQPWVPCFMHWTCTGHPFYIW